MRGILSLLASIQEWHEGEKKIISLGRPFEELSSAKQEIFVSANIAKPIIDMLKIFFAGIGKFVCVIVRDMLT